MGISRHSRLPASVAGRGLIFSLHLNLILIVLVLCLSGCGDIQDDILPSGADRRPDVVGGSIGNQPGQTAPDFTVPDAFGDDFNLSTELPFSRAVVLYFTMWCPICDSHMSHLNGNVIPLYPDVAFYVVDFVSGSVADARSLQTSHGFASAGFTVLADLDGTVEDLYGGTMGTTVVIDQSGLVLMNEDYRDGTNLMDVLDTVP